MKRVLSIMICAALFAPALLAQDHGEMGVFADYFRAQATRQNLFGAGGRLSVNVHPNLALEAEGAYDFEQSQTQSANFATGISSTARSSLRTTHGLFGPKFQLGKNFPLRAFITLKGGFLRFGTNTGAATFQNGQFTNFNNTDLNGVFYPGGGIEGFFKFVGIRLDVGDEIYFDNGANHNLKITLGPHIRF